MHVLFRGPGEVQVGTDLGTRHVLTGLSEPEQKLLLALPRLSPAQVERARAQRGISPARWAKLTKDIREDPPVVGVRGTVVALDAHPLTERVREVLERMGIPTVGASAAVAGSRVALLTDTWVTPPTRVSELMAGDVPHLPIVVEAAATIIGPAVVPGATPCTTCIHLARTELDSAWPVLAAQLAHTPARRPNLIELETAAGLAAHALAGLLRGHMGRGWFVSAERCMPLAPPAAVPCGCGGIMQLSEDGRARA